VASAPAGSTVSIIVRASSGARGTAAAAVRSVGGRIGRGLPIIRGFVATVPAGAIGRLRSARGVLSVTANAPVTFSSQVDDFDPTKAPGSWCKWAANTHMKEMWQAGYTGQGIDVALIDSGVAPVAGIATKVVNGPDLSFDSQAANLRYIDGYGHGTHMAGLIAGRDTSIPSTKEDDQMCSAFVGAAPGARVVNVKVAASDGATDVSQVIAGIDWVVQHRFDNGMNIRVLNLSFGTDSTQSYLVDPLAYAAEVAWLHGIVVVVAAGNTGFGSARVNDPAIDPYVISVGADDTRGTDGPDDDVIPSFQTRGDSTRHPDLVAPGQSIVSLRDPGGQLDQAHPGAEVGTVRFFRGSGSSQATAIVSGAVADLLQEHPGLTPDQVKALIMRNASPLKNTDATAQGAGLLNMHNVRDAKVSTVAGAVQNWPTSAGDGSLQDARGSLSVVDNGVALAGEQDIFGQAWDGKSWSCAAWLGKSWSGGDWNGHTWSGGDWSADSWSGKSWSANSWAGKSWSGKSWSGKSWSGKSWSGGGWSGGVWGNTDGISNPLTGASWSSSIWE
jgi:serine protease AprX